MRRRDGEPINVHFGPALFAIADLCGPGKGDAGCGRIEIRSVCESHGFDRFLKGRRDVLHNHLGTASVNRDEAAVHLGYVDQQA